MDAPTAAFAARLDSLADLVLLVDVDGTLAPIVDDPAAVAVPRAALDALATIARAARLVGVVSGRPVAMVDRLVPVPGLWRAGAHGVEIVRRDGSEDVDQAPRRARPQLDRAAAIAAEAGWRLEDKGTSVTVHARGDADAAAILAAARAAFRAQLDPALVEVHDARMAVEVRAAGARTKADAVRLALADAGNSSGNGHLVAAFVGDDRTDLDAFAALDELGPYAIRVAVDSPEAPPELLAAADVTVDGVDGVHRMLAGLAELAGA
jgi:trehalose-phosphatase